MITRRSAALSPFVLMLLAREAAANEDIVFALDMSGPRPVVQISLTSGTNESWIFDTGAAGSVIREDRATALGLPNLGPARVGSPIGGTPVEAFRTSVTGARIGELALPDFTAVAMPMPVQLTQTGVLSPNVFRGRLVRFEFGRGQVRVTDRANAPATQPTPYMGAHPLPGIRVSVGGQTHDAHLDTGAPHVVSFPYAMASTLPLTGAPVLGDTPARFVDGERARYTAQINGVVQIGPLALTNPEVALIDGLPFVNVGTQALRQMIVTLDPERRVSWVELA